MMESDCILPYTNPVVRTTLAVGYMCVAVIATTLNILVFILFCRRRALRSGPERLLISLAISDLIVGIFAAPLRTAQLIKGPQISSDILERVCNSAKTLVATTGIIVAIVAYDRYQFITKGQPYNTFLSSWRLKLLLVLPWLLPPSLLVFKFINEHAHKWAILLLYIVGWPTIFISYWKLKRHLEKRKTEWEKKLSRPYAEQMAVKTIKTLRLLKAINIAFLVCSSPLLAYRIVITCSFYVKDGIPWVENHKLVIVAVVQLVFQANSCLNPILYFGLSEDFLAALTALFRKRTAIGRGHSTLYFVDKYRSSVQVDTIAWREMASCSQDNTTNTDSISTSFTNPCGAHCKIGYQNQGYAVTSM